VVGEVVVRDGESTDFAVFELEHQLQTVDGLAAHAGVAEVERREVECLLAQQVHNQTGGLVPEVVVAEVAHAQTGLVRLAHHQPLGLLEREFAVAHVDHLVRELLLDVRVLPLPVLDFAFDFVLQVVVHVCDLLFHRVLDLSLQVFTQRVFADFCCFIIVEIIGVLSYVAEACEPVVVCVVDSLFLFAFLQLDDLLGDDFACARVDVQAALFEPFLEVQRGFGLLVGGFYLLHENLSQFVFPIVETLLVDLYFGVVH